MRLHHVQIAIPVGGEAVARRFYVEGLDMQEIAKPEELAGRGGAWFCSQQGAEIHVGVEEPFAPARKAHPALVVASVAALDEIAARLTALGFVMDDSQRASLPGFLRFHAFDGHGNRVELLTPSAQA